MNFYSVDSHFLTFFTFSPTFSLQSSFDQLITCLVVIQDVNKSLSFFLVDLQIVPEVQAFNIVHIYSNE